MATTRPVDYPKEFAAAAAAGVCAYAATVLSDNLTVSTRATACLLATLAGWTIGRVITHSSQRWANATLSVLLITGSIVVGVTGTRTRCAPKGIACIVGACEQFSVYVQNKWEPYGAALRTEPRRDATQIAGYDPNQLIPVDGWVRTAAPYPQNRAPFNNDVWFHVAPDRGWVSFAAVRSDPTEPSTDPDDDGGAPAPTPPECRGTFRSNT